MVRRPYQPRLFGEEEIYLKERYKVIATNLDWPKDVVVKWYDKDCVSQQEGFS